MSILERSRVRVDLYVQTNTRTHGYIHSYTKVRPLKAVAACPLPLTLVAIATPGLFPPDEESRVEAAVVGPLGEEKEEEEERRVARFIASEYMCWLVREIEAVFICPRAMYLLFVRGGGIIVLLGSALVVVDVEKGEG